ncbi:MAG: hypothetical protein NTW30_02160 [Candidatus Aenigmarchaeota archaeon]|nr:hypothetical protein [Candidatus Aenigmarchaeota archaeon]
MNIKDIWLIKMSIRIEPPLEFYNNALRKLEKYGIDFEGIESALLKEGLKIRSSGTVLISHIYDPAFRIAMSLTDPLPEHITYNELKKQIYEKINSALKKVLSEKIDGSKLRSEKKYGRRIRDFLSDKWYPKSIEETQLFQYIREIFTYDAMVFDDTESAGQQLTRRKSG